MPGITWEFQIDAEGTLQNAPSDLERLVIPPGVKRIKAELFQYNQTIKEVVLPEGLETIGYNAFYSCISLESITLPLSLKSVELNRRSWNQYGPFARSGLREVHFPDGVERLCPDLFGGCPQLKSVSLPASIREIGPRAFRASGLQEIVLPEGLETLGRHAFSDCWSLKRVELPLSLRRVDSKLGDIDAEGPFAGSGLQTVKLPEGLTLVWDGVFSKCKHLEIVSLPRSVRRIGEAAFLESGVRLLSLQEGLEEVGRLAFARCGSLEQLDLPSTCREVADGAFESSALAEVRLEDGPAVIGRRAFAGTKLATVSLPEGVRTLGACAFMDCSELIRVEFPLSLQEVGVEEAKGPFHGSGLRSVRLPMGLTTIWGYVFENCVGLEMIEVPESVQVVGRAAFEGAGLRQFRLPEAGEQIEEGAFLNCRRLTEVGMADSVRRIGAEAFAGSGLKRIRLSASLQQIGEAAFQHCSELEDAKLPPAARAIGARAYKGTGIRRIAIPEGTKEVDASVFEGCDRLEEVRLPDTVTSIGPRAFSGCFSLKDLVLPDGLTAVGDDAFYGCWRSADSLTRHRLFYEGTGEGVAVAADDCGQERGSASAQDPDQPQEPTPADCGQERGSASAQAPDLPQEPKPADPTAILAQERYRTGLCDQNGCIVEDDVLIRFCLLPGQEGRIRISDGVRVIPAGVLGDLNARFNTTSSAWIVSLPDSVRRIEDEEFCHHVYRMDLPRGYLRQVEPLPVEPIRVLLAGGWKALARLEDYAALWLYQDDPRLDEICESRLLAEPKRAAMILAGLLQENGTPERYTKVAGFVVGSKHRVQPDDVAFLCDQARGAGASEALGLLSPVCHLCQDVPAEIPLSPATAESFCQAHFTETYLDQSLRRAGLVEADLTGVVYRESGAPVPPFVVKAAIVPYMDLTKEEPVRWRQDLGGRTAPYQPIPRADQVAALFDQASLIRMLRRVWERLARDAGHEGYRNYYFVQVGRKRPQFLFPLVRFGDSATVNETVALIDQLYSSKLSSVSAGKARYKLRGLLMLNSSERAVSWVIESADFTRYAFLHGFDPGLLFEPFWNRLHLPLETGGRVKIRTRWYSFDLKPGRSLSVQEEDSDRVCVLELTRHLRPVAVRERLRRKLGWSEYYDEEAEALEAVANSFLALQGYKASLSQAMYEGRTLSAQAWRRLAMSHPAVSSFARRVVWRQSGTTFIMTDDGLRGPDGPVQLKDCDGAPVEVVHPMDLGPDELDHWRHWLQENGVEQPFPQIFEPVVDLAVVKEADYLGCRIDYDEQKKLRQTFGEHYVDAHIDFSFDKSCAALRLDDQPDKKQNGFIVMLNQIVIGEKIRNRDPAVNVLLANLPIDEADDLIQLARESKNASALAVLLEQKNRLKEEFGAKEEDVMDEFSLD